MSAINILRKRNLQTYNEIIKRYEKVNRLLLEQETGTGKSFIGIQYLLDHLEQKSLFIAPRKGIIDQFVEHIDNLVDDQGNSIMVRRKDKERQKSRNSGYYTWEISTTGEKLKLEARTYDWLNYRSDEELINYKADFIMTDEAHKAAAPGYNNRLKVLFDSHEDSFMLGMTATPNRNKGKKNQLNVGDPSFLFDGNVVKGETIEEALLCGDFLMPIVIKTAIYYDRKLDTFENKIIRSINHKEKRQEALKELKILREALNVSESITEIFKKYIKPDAKLIVFCNIGESKEVENIKDIERKMKLIPQWFQQVTNKENIEIYQCTYDHPNATKEAYNFAHNLDKDGKDCSHKLRIMCAINKYNEGIHVDDIDGVILTRYTESEIVFHQQVGRIFAVGKNKRQLIIDLAGNFDRFKELKDVLVKRQQEIKKVRERRQIEHLEDTDVVDFSSINIDDFKLIDEFIEMEEAIKVFSKKIFMSKMEKALEYAKTVERLKREPESKTKTRRAEIVFNDGMDQRTYAFEIDREYNKLLNKKTLTTKEQEIIKCHEIIEEARIKHIEEYEPKVFMTNIEKAYEYAKTIERLKKEPRIVTKEKEGEAQFLDKTDQRSFAVAIEQKYKKVINKKTLSKVDKSIIDCYEIIRDARNTYIPGYKDKVPMTKVEKAEEYIKTIKRLKREPLKDEKEESPLFQDQKNKNDFMQTLKYQYKKIMKKEQDSLTQAEKETIKCYQMIDEAIWQNGKEQLQKYFDMYQDTRVVRDYKTVEQFKLRKWLDEQRNNYLKDEKDLIQLERERQLSEISPTWMEPLEIEDNEREREIFWAVIYERNWLDGYKAMQKYYDQYHNLDVPKTYRGENCFNLNWWLENQRRDFFKINKDQVQLEHEEKLNTLFPGWLGEKYTELYTQIQVEALAKEKGEVEHTTPKSI